MTKCIFCQVAEGNASSDIVYQDDSLVAFNDINPEAPTHILIIPRRHISSLDLATEEDVDLLGKMIFLATKLAREKSLSDGYRLVVNNGAKAGQTIDHLHFHLLGGRHFSWPPG